MEKQNLSILVVDDEEAIASILVRFIESLGHSSGCAGSCDEALNKLIQDDFDLAFIDINLPDGSGIELMKQTKVLFPKINLVAMSGGANLNEEIEIRKQRVMFYMIKPFTRQQIKDILDHVTKRKLSGLNIEK